MHRILINSRGFIGDFHGSTFSLLVWIFSRMKNPLARGDFVVFELFSESCCFLLSSVEFVDGTCLEECLLSCVEWMTFAACFYANLI